MRLILEVISGPFLGKRIEAKVGQIVRIGRTTKSDIAMEDGFMSGEHFAIECKHRSCHLRDLNSRNGTQVNGETVTEVKLRDGDQVHAGRTDFTVRIEDALKTVEISADGQDALRVGDSQSDSQSGKSRGRKQSKRAPAESVPEELPSAESGFKGLPAPEEIPTPQEESISPSAGQVTKRPPPHETAKEPSAQTSSEAKPVLDEPLVTPPLAQDVVAPSAIESYEAATPEGRLIQILSSQPGTLMALIDAVRDDRVLELLSGTTEEYQSLYRREQNTKLAPYLVRLPPRSELLKRMVEQGWGHEWGVYLTCPVSLSELREYFRSSLMVTMPDGMELFSRFYDPKFFRTFLETCTAPEAEKFFGPITSYFMEEERPGILLQFRRGRKGAEKKGHLLSAFG